MNKRERYLTIGGFLLPSAVLYAVFFLFPMAQAFYVALFRWSGLSMNRDFVGVENFRKLLSQDPVFWQSLGHNMVFLVASFVIVLPLALFFAVMLSRNTRGCQTYGAIYLFPNVISIVAVAVLWSFVYHPTFGILNSLLHQQGRGWLGDPKTALLCVVATGIWHSLGFYIVLLLAGVQNVPRSYYEAAWIDGAGGWQAFRHITIPLIWEVLKLAVIYLVINSLNVFGLVWVMTEGGPGNHTDTVLTHLYRTAFIDSNFGYATALGVVVFVIIFCVTLGFNRLMRRETVEY
jgi:N-acetylglucosamine transport system permease protein